MTTAPLTADHITAGQNRLIRYLDVGGLILTLLTVVVAVIWAFPLYWAVVTTFKPEHEVIRPFIELWPENFTLEAYFHIIANTRIVRLYINSIITSLSI
jgi:multiple sugar transport system permease protein